GCPPRVGPPVHMHRGLGLETLCHSGRWLRSRSGCLRQRRPGGGLNGRRSARADWLLLRCRLGGPDRGGRGMVYGGPPGSWARAVAGELHLVGELVLLESEGGALVVQVLGPGRRREQGQQHESDACRAEPAHPAGSQEGEKDLAHHVLLMQWNAGWYWPCSL